MKQHLQIVGAINDILVKYVSVVSIVCYQLNRAMVDIIRQKDIYYFVNDLVIHIDNVKHK